MDFRNQTALARGLRNNNPGNIKTGQGWKGVVGNDGTFDIFTDDTWGLRALAMDLQAKLNRGLTTIRQIISEYAPPSENDTDKYIAAVAAQSGIGADDPLTYPDDWPDLMRAIVTHENGDQAAMISDADITQGISMMGGGPGVLVQSAIDAVSNNTDNATFIAAGLVIGVILFFFSSRKK